MTTAYALMRTEFTLLRRDTTAWTTAIALPFLLGAVWMFNPPPMLDGGATVAVLQVMGLLVFTLHTVGVMALAARRDQLVLKRWRTSQAEPMSILAGSIGVPAGLVIAQAVALAAITAAVTGARPANVAVLALGVLSGVAVIGAATFVVAGFTRSPEHAMVTTVPVLMVLMVAAMWSLGRPFDPFDLTALALPSGATIQLLRLGWDGPVGDGGLHAWVTAAAPSVVAAVVYTALGSAAAARWFRWEPRR